MIFVSLKRLTQTNQNRIDTMKTTECWEEKQCAELIAKIKNSKYKTDILFDVQLFLDEGFSPDVALQKSWNYWK
jgi:hypothetical protein